MNHEMEQLVSRLTHDELGVVERAYLDQLLVQYRHILDKYHVGSVKEFVDVNPEAEDLRAVVGILRSVKGIRNQFVELSELCGEKYEVIKEMFGENFYGIDEVEHAFFIRPSGDAVKFSDQQRAEIRKALDKKISEPDVQEFLRRIQSGEVSVDDFQLILRVPKFVDRRGITIERMRVLYNRLLFDEDLPLIDTDSTFLGYRNSDTPSDGFEWVFVSRDCVDGTFANTTVGQRMEIRRFAKHVGFEKEYVSPRTAVQVMYDYFVSSRNRGIVVHDDLIEGYERTCTLSSSRTVSVGGLGQGCIMYITSGMGSGGNNQHSSVGMRMQR